MRIPVLVDLQQEVNRLYIAGSKFANNDPRLKKFIPTLDAMAQKAPVFKKISENLTALIESNEQESAQKLFEVGNLLYAILYTQCDTTLESSEPQNSLTPLISLTESKTALKYSQLKPVIEALSQSNSGRYEVIREAFENKLLLDTRFYPYIAKAVNDKYSELSTYIINTVIPTIGTPIVPFILDQVTYEDNSINIRTIEALHSAGYPELLQILDKIVENDNTTKLLGAALALYKAFPQREEVLYRYTDHRNAAVRAGAFHALAQINTETSIKHLLLILENKKTDIYQTAILQELGNIENKQHCITKFFYTAKLSVERIIDTVKSSNSSNSSYSFYGSMRLPLALIDKDNSERNIDFLLQTAIEVIENFKKFDYEIICILDTVDTLSFENRKAIYEKIMKAVEGKPYYKSPNGPLERFVNRYFEFCLKTETDKEIVLDKFSPLLKNGLLSFHCFNSILNVYADHWSKPLDNSYRLSEKWYSSLIDHLTPDLKIKHIHKKSQSFQSMIYIMIYFNYSIKGIEEFIKENSSIKLNEQAEQYFNEYKAAK